ncbi:MAG: RrF2 family transcriptional regulator [Elusimicrobiota bacterium]
MKLNQKINYGVACLFELSKHPHEFIDTESISHKQNIPLAYAHKILQLLAHDGLVFSQKGLGYKLARPLSEVTALHVIEILGTESNSISPSNNVSDLLEARVNQALGSFTLNDLLARA